MHLLTHRLNEYIGKHVIIIMNGVQYSYKVIAVESHILHVRGGTIQQPRQLAGLFSSEDNLVINLKSGGYDRIVFPDNRGIEDLIPIYVEEENNRNQNMHVVPKRVHRKIAWLGLGIMIGVGIGIGYFLTKK